MKIEKIGILVVAAAVLMVMASSMAMASTYTYDNPVKSYITSWGTAANQASASWYSGYGSDGQHMDVNRGDIGLSYIVAENYFTNSASHVGTVGIYWNRIAHDSDWDTCLAEAMGGYYYSSGLNYGETSPQSESGRLAQISESADSDLYYYDQGHSYYPSNYPFSQYSYSPNPMAQKEIDLV